MKMSRLGTGSGAVQGTGYWVGIGLSSGADHLGGSLLEQK